MKSQNSTNLFIGIDGGGTHTRAIAMDTFGKIVGTGVSTGSNPNNVGFEQAANCILEAIKSTNASLSEKTSICMGIAGLATAEHQDKMGKQLKANFPILENCQLRITHDLEIAHYAAFEGKAGIILIAGTGSACFAQTLGGMEFRASGRSYHYEDPGSGYAIGKRAIEKKLLDPAESRPSVAALATEVIRLATEGNLDALGILQLEAEHLANLAEEVYSQVNAHEKCSSLALSGSLLSSDSIYSQIVLTKLKSIAPDLEITKTKTSPEQAALILAGAKR